MTIGQYIDEVVSQSGVVVEIPPVTLVSVRPGNLVTVEWTDHRDRRYAWSVIIRYAPVERVLEAFGAKADPRT